MGLGLPDGRPFWVPRRGAGLQLDCDSTRQGVLRKVGHGQGAMQCKRMDNNISFTCIQLSTSIDIYLCIPRREEAPSLWNGEAGSRAFRVSQALANVMPALCQHFWYQGLSEFEFPEVCWNSSSSAAFATYPSWLRTRRPHLKEEGSSSAGL